MVLGGRTSSIMRLVASATLFVIAFWGCSSQIAPPPVAGAQAALALTVSTLKAGTTVRIVLLNVSNTPVQKPSAKLASWLAAVARNQQLTYSGTMAPGARQLLSF